MKNYPVYQKHSTINIGHNFKYFFGKISFGNICGQFVRHGERTIVLYQFVKLDNSTPIRQAINFRKAEKSTDTLHKKRKTYTNLGETWTALESRVIASNG